MRSPQGPVASFCGGSGQLYPLFPETWGLTRAGLFSRACYSPLQTASYLFPLRPSLYATCTVSDTITCSHISLLGLLQIFLSLHWLGVFFSPTPFPFLPVWILPSFHGLYSNPTFFLQPSLIIQPRRFSQGHSKLFDSSGLLLQPPCSAIIFMVTW